MHRLPSHQIRWSFKTSMNLSFRRNDLVQGEEKELKDAWEIYKGSYYIIHFAHKVDDDTLNSVPQKKIKCHSPFLVRILLKSVKACEKRKKINTLYYLFLLCSFVFSRIIQLDSKTFCKCSSKFRTFTFSGNDYFGVARSYCTVSKRRF